MLRAAQITSITVLCLLMGGGDGWSRGRRRRPPRPAARPAAKPNPNARIVVQDVPPAPKKKAKKKVKPKITPSYRYRRRYYGSSRRSSPLYLRAAPKGADIIRLNIGIVVNVVKRGPTWSQVETGGKIRVKGYVPNVTLGLRVQKKAKLFGRPGGKSIGEVSAGVLVQVIKTTGAWAQVRLMGYLPVSVYLKRKLLSVKSSSYGYLRGRYPGGSTMVVSAGPLHAKPGGAVVARALDEGRIYRVTVLGKWSQIAVYDYSHVSLRVWVPTARIRWGRYPWYGSGYRQRNCVTATSGSMASLAKFRLYAEKDDAWPTITVMPGARFNVVNDREGWVRVSVYSCLNFTAYAQDRPGDWAPYSAIRWRKR